MLEEEEIGRGLWRNRAGGDEVVGGIQREDDKEKEKCKEEKKKDNLPVAANDGGINDQAQWSVRGSLMGDEN
ncbi:hypothetical protein LR48_Vigan07g257800 [Vigna angularis]|uniref:Uncharacterized protein n=1 Tax=Phaseolus angularis TaxID=3914 RepID=A0A0L9V293_PHAAN|nr:hypothetical protein LR48_Vigan07g257800 [Vigna angularis]